LKQVIEVIEGQCERLDMKDGMRPIRARV
jgi:hypothetical protein